MAALLLLAVLVSRRRVPAPLPFTVNDGSDVQQTHHCGNDGVSDDVAAVAVTGELEAQTTVDDSEDNSDAANADVGI